MVTPKFKVGDVLKPIVDDTGLLKAHVIEVQIQTCSRNAQIFYHCRLHTKPYKDAPASVTCKYIVFNEIELEEWRDMKSKE